MIGRNLGFHAKSRKNVSLTDNSSRERSERVEWWIGFNAKISAHKKLPDRLSQGGGTESHLHPGVWKRLRFQMNVLRDCNVKLTMKPDNKWRSASMCFLSAKTLRRPQTVHHSRGNFSHCSATGTSLCKVWKGNTHPCVSRGYKIEKKQVCVKTNLHFILKKSTLWKRVKWKKWATIVLQRSRHNRPALPYVHISFWLLFLWRDCNERHVFNTKRVEIKNCVYHLHFFL